MLQWEVLQLSTSANVPLLPLPVYPGVLPGDIATLLSATLLPKLRVKEWVSTRAETFVKLSRQFGPFYADACQRVDVIPPAALYWFEGDTELIASRKKLLPDNYDAFVALCLDGLRPTVHVFKIADTCSPDESPAARVAPPEGPPSHASGSGGRRDTGKQAEFRASLLRRDGAMCMLCHESRDATSLEAAHIIPQGAAESVLAAHGLVTAACPQNGIMLCGVCYEFFDRWMWHVTAAGTVVVADALLHDKDGSFKRYWVERNGRTLYQTISSPSPLWPPPLVWAFRQNRFGEEQGLRWQSAAKPKCSKCGQTCKSDRGIAAHIDSGKCQRTVLLGRRVVHATPAKHRRAGGGSGGDDKGGVQTQPAQAGAARS
jgi:hypothetical protein